MAVSGGQCSACGMENPSTSQSCVRCGQPLPWAQQASAPPIPPPGAPLVVSGPYFEATTPAPPSRIKGPGCLPVLGVMLACMVLVIVITYVLPNLIFWSVLLSAFWVYFDASKIGVRKGQIKGIYDMSPAAWATATGLLWLLTFPAYLVARPIYLRVNGKT